MQSRANQGPSEGESEVGRRRRRRPGEPAALVPAHLGACCCEEPGQSLAGLVYRSHPPTAQPRPKPAPTWPRLHRPPPRPRPRTASTRQRSSYRRSPAPSTATALPSSSTSSSSESGEPDLPPPSCPVLLDLQPRPARPRQLAEHHRPRQRSSNADSSPSTPARRAFPPYPLPAPPSTASATRRLPAASACRSRTSPRSSTASSRTRSSKCASLPLAPPRRSRSL